MFQKSVRKEVHKGFHLKMNTALKERQVFFGEGGLSNPPVPYKQVIKPASPEETGYPTRQSGISMFNNPPAKKYCVFKKILVLYIEKKSLSSLLDRIKMTPFFASNT
jgi:hypothetical protein